MKMKVQRQYAASVSFFQGKSRQPLAGFRRLKEIFPGADRLQNGMPKKHFASRKCLYLIGLACV